MTSADTNAASDASRGVADPRIRIVLNPGSGHQGNPAYVDDVRAFAGAHSDRVELLELGEGQSPTDLARRALDEGVGTVVAAGGDGTIAGVATALHGSDVRFGILPMGTFNFFARGLGIPLDVGLALELLLDGPTRPVTVAEVNGALFLNNASLGVYPAILERRESVYKRWGRSRLAAYWSVLLTLAGFDRARRVEVTVDGVPRRRKTPLIFVANSDYQLDEYGLDGADYIRDGHFAVFLAPDVGRWGLLKYAVRLLGRSMTRHRDFELLHGREIVVGGTGRRLVARDGEREKMQAPIRFSLLDNALQVVVPPEALDGPRAVGEGGDPGSVDPDAPQGRAATGGAA